MHDWPLSWQAEEKKERKKEKKKKKRKIIGNNCPLLPPPPPFWRCPCLHTCKPWSRSSSFNLEFWILADMSLSYRNNLYNITMSLKSHTRTCSHNGVVAGVSMWQLQGLCGCYGVCVNLWTWHYWILVVYMVLFQSRSKHFTVYF